MGVATGAYHVYSGRKVRDGGYMSLLAALFRQARHDGDWAWMQTVGARWLDMLGASREQIVAYGREEET